ncbi:Gx transporter family protein [bacterium]|nr:Gx transporter family protein [bacterium]
MRISSEQNANLINYNKIAVLGIFIALGTVIWILEEFIPRPIPWMKMGFANLITMVILYRFGFRSAAIVSFMRIILGATLTGKLLSPTMLISLSGMFLALSGMALVFFLLENQISLPGLSIAGAFLHNLGQLLTASLVIIRKPELFYLLPYFSIASILSGGLIGILSVFIIRLLFRDMDNDPV